MTAPIVLTSYPSFDVVVDVAADASVSLTNQAHVSVAGNIETSNEAYRGPPARMAPTVSQ
jgi:hypothetical protein